MHRLSPLSVLALAAAIFTACAARLPVSDYARTPSHAIPQTEDGALERALTFTARAHPNESGFKLLPRGSDAFIARIALVEAAEHTLDLQYFSIGDDITGQLILEEILRAAKRGVRVRLLVDDLSIRKVNHTLAVLNATRNIEIRVFNPFATRNESLLERLGNEITHFEHLDRRMHNKSLIADNQVAIVGGRNLGDEYFDSSSDFNFRDLDTLAAGPIVNVISQSFDHYWNSAEAYPITALDPPISDPQTMREMREALQHHWQAVMASEPGKAAWETRMADRLKNGTLSFTWAKAEFDADSPRKVDKPADNVRSKPALAIERRANDARRSLLIISPYFVPADGVIPWLKGLSSRGVKVSVLTNSLASTDVVIVDAGYSRYRGEVVDAGVNLYEFKPVAGKRPKSTMFGSSSRASLHTKAYVVDTRILILGSFNLDPRSLDLNTEQMLVIHSPTLAAQVADIFAHVTSPAASYRVMRENGPDSPLVWVTQENGREVRYSSDPHPGLWRSVEVLLYSLLPIDRQL